MTRLHSSLTVLSPEEIEKIHRASLRVLERVGVKMPQADCLKICAQAGALVDIDSALVQDSRRGDGSGARGDPQGEQAG